MFRTIASFAIAWLITVSPTRACKCAGPGTVQEAFYTSAVVVHGRVLEVKTVRWSETLPPESVRKIKKKLRSEASLLIWFDSLEINEVSVLVLKHYKSKSTRDTLTIYTGANSASCGFQFKTGKEYIIYGQENYNAYYHSLQLDPEDFQYTPKQNIFWTHACTRTSEYSSREEHELRRLKEQQETAFDWESRDAFKNSIGFACSADGRMSEPVHKVTMLLGDKEVKAIRKLLFSDEPAEQFLAAFVVGRLTHKNQMNLTPEESDRIRYIRTSDQKVPVCAGCTYWTEAPLKTLLDAESKHLIYETARVWFDRYYEFYYQK